MNPTRMKYQLSTSEIIESTMELENELRVDEKAGKNNMILKSTNNHSIEEDINSLFEAIDVRTSSSRNMLHKNAMKRPVRVGYSHASGIGISGPVSLKQAFRGICITQASEMAATKKRLLKQGGSSRVSAEATVKGFYRAVVIDESKCGDYISEEKGNLVEISLAPQKIPSYSCQEMVEHSEKLEVVFSKETDQPSACLKSTASSKESMVKSASSGQIAPIAEDSVGEISKAKSNKLKSVVAASTAPNEVKIQKSGGISSVPVTVQRDPQMPNKEQQDKLHSGSSLTSFSDISRVQNSAIMSPGMLKPFFKSKIFTKRKGKQSSTSGGKANPTSDKSISDQETSTSYSSCQSDLYSLKSGSKKKSKASPGSSSCHSIEVSSSIVQTSSSQNGLSPSCSSGSKSNSTKVEEKSISRGKGEFSQGSKSSIGDYSSTTASVSEDSSLSGSSRIGNRPHMSRDIRWESINAVKKQHQNLDWRQFKLLKKLGCGDIATVYMAELIGTNCLFALKVMDNELLLSRKKMLRAQTEREILQELDHPFLPTLYAHFASSKLSCLVMEYCPGGDLHVIRQMQTYKSFSEHAARFYIAEVLLALEYLHMLGVVYRDLKPENVLVREDGHIMLSDFDLSLRCAVSPVLLRSSSPNPDSSKKTPNPGTETSCIDPFCLNPSFQMPCFTPKLVSITAKSQKTKSDLAAQVSPLPQIVVEPTDARSNSFVGTHEYLAPEIIKGQGHGSAVDWWTFGIFLFELLFGKTPFKGSSNDETLANVVSHSLNFPSTPIVSFHARDLIRMLLIKEPGNRLGSVKGAAEIKQHPFFEGLNWALIRCATPPELPKLCDMGTKVSEKCEGSQGVGEALKFDMF